MHHLGFSKRFTYLTVSFLISVAVSRVALAWAEKIIQSAEQTGNTSGVAFELDMMVRRLRSFRTAAAHRNVRCTYADVWSLSPPVAMVRARRALLKRFDVEKQESAFQLVRTPGGTYWIPIRDFDTLAETLAEQQSKVYDGAVASVRRGDVVLDCGANVGAFTRHALDMGARLVVAIEMAPESLICLRKNLENEIASGRVVVYPKGVWNEDAELELSTGSAWASTASSVVLDRGSKGIKVPLTTIDTLVGELKLPTVDFIKLDIEGAEIQALRGALQTVRRFQPRMAISVEHRASDPDQIPRVVQQLWPNYLSHCGPCTNVNGSIQPDVLFARAE